MGEKGVEPASVVRWEPKGQPLGKVGGTDGEGQGRSTPSTVIEPVFLKFLIFCSSWNYFALI